MIRHNLIATCVHWDLCRKFEIKLTETWYEHVPLPNMVSQTGNEILWEVEIKATTKIKHKRPDIIVMMPRESKWRLNYIAIRGFQLSF